MVYARIQAEILAKFILWIKLHEMSISKSW
jgi:hypothetical protein